MPESEANPRIEQAYSRFIEKYPNSNSVPIAALKLGKTKFKMELWPDAIYYLEKFIQEDGGKASARVVTDVLRDLAHAYEQVNKPDIAAEMRGLIQTTSSPVADDTPSESMFQISWSYYRQARQYKKQGRAEQAKDYFRKAIAESERVIRELPPSPAHSPQAYFMTAVCYSQELGEYQKGIEYFQQVVDNWPDYQDAWHAQYSVGKYYGILWKKGVIPESEASVKIEEAYRVLVDQYPDSVPAPHAALRLGSIHLQKEQLSGAARYYEFFLQKYQGQRPTLIIDIIYQLAQAYEKMGEFDKAVEKYGIFMEIAPSVYPDDSRMDIVRAKLKRMEGVDR